ncbi:hypothetical protein H5410_050669 [Solanum commersonii]|uniref:Uncharacterized protein n=1 Tax=Solanum commersonii TaxID=4109 RepID=A0A9J5WW74_SOLCO|nr:hypothetical protein H5410_050669 [Solanum commersonii]
MLKATESIAGSLAFPWKAKICRHIIQHSTIFQLKKLKILMSRLLERALGIKALYVILKRFYNEDCRVIDQDHDWVLITRGKSKSKELKERILDIELHRLGATEETWKLACKMLDHDHP